jgi:hypothetical protein
MVLRSCGASRPTPRAKGARGAPETKRVRAPPPLAARRSAPATARATPARPPAPSARRSRPAAASPAGSRRTARPASAPAAAAPALARAARASRPPGGAVRASPSRASPVGACPTGSTARPAPKGPASALVASGAIALSEMSSSALAQEGRPRQVNVHLFESCARTHLPAAFLPATSGEQGGGIARARAFVRVHVCVIGRRGRRRGAEPGERGRGRRATAAAGSRNRVPAALPARRRLAAGPAINRRGDPALAGEEELHPGRLGEFTTSDAHLEL